MATTGTRSEAGNVTRRPRSGQRNRQRHPTEERADERYGRQARGQDEGGGGNLTGDRDLEREGKADQAVGATKSKLDDAKDWADDKLDDVKEAIDRR